MFFMIWITLIIQNMFIALKNLDTITTKYLLFVTTYPLIYYAPVNYFFNGDHLKSQPTN